MAAAAHPSSSTRKRAASTTTAEAGSPRHRPRTDPTPLCQTALTLTRRPADTTSSPVRATGDGPAAPPPTSQRVTVATWNLAGFIGNKVAGVTRFLLATRLMYV